MKTDLFVQKLKKRHFSPFMGVPCSVFKPLLNYITKDSLSENYICSSEGEAMGLAAGFALSGKIPVVYMQNDGYGNAINPLSSLQLMYKLPVLMLISWRAEPNKNDAPQHEIMGETITQLLETFSIPYRILSDSDIDESLKYAEDYIKTESKPFALIIKKGYFDTVNIEKKNQEQLNSRMEYLKILYNNIKDKDILLGTTGFSGRELYQTLEHEGKFYMMGSMGCLSSIGLGIALENPDRRVFIIDGDGALLMKMGSLSTIGLYEPKNLIHICFDNNEYESTGGQPTSSIVVDFTGVAKSCNYKSSIKINRLEDFKRLIVTIDDFPKPLFVHIKIKSGTVKSLKRPENTPEDMKNKLMGFLKK